MKFEIHKDYKEHQDFLNNCIHNFDKTGEPFGNQNRNSLKLFRTESLTLNIKSFKVPNIINKVVYKYFRKSKAQRSYEYALRLKERGVNTPNPIAYFEEIGSLFFGKSYYISQQLDSDLTYRELTKDLNYPQHETILRAFTRFTFKLHEKGIHFLDHSPGNTLIKKTNNSFEFYLVDLNRMKFEQLNFEERIKNFSRLTTHKSMVEVMSDEYAKVSGLNKEKVLSEMWKLTQDFQKQFHRRQKMKRKIKFWKNYN